MDFDSFKQLFHDVIFNTANREQVEETYNTFMQTNLRLFLSYLIQIIQQPTEPNDQKNALVLLNSAFLPINKELITANIMNIADIFIPFLQSLWQNDTLQDEYSSEIFTLYVRTLHTYFSSVWTDSFAFLQNSLKSENNSIFMTSIQMMCFGAVCHLYEFDTVCEVCIPIFQTIFESNENSLSFSA